MIDTSTMWYLSRATGIVAMILVVAALAWGFFFSARATGKKLRPAWWLDLHNWLGGLALIFTGVHIAAAWLDTNSGIGLLQIFVPGTTTGTKWPIAWGVLSTYLLAATVFTTWPRRLKRRRMWRVIHLSSVAATALALLHTHPAWERHDPWSVSDGVRARRGSSHLRARPSTVLTSNVSRTPANRQLRGRRTESLPDSQPGFIRRQLAAGSIRAMSSNPGKTSDADARLARLASRRLPPPTKGSAAPVAAHAVATRRRHPSRGSRGAALALSLITSGGLTYVFATTGTASAHQTATPAAVVPPVATSSAVASGGSRVVNGAVAPNRFGDVQVQASFAANGSIAAVTILQAPSGNNRSTRINNNAVPILDSEAVSVQSANVNAVSGATFTSNSYQQSLQSAIDAARSSGITQLA